MTDDEKMKRSWELYQQREQEVERFTKVQQDEDATEEETEDALDALANAHIAYKLALGAVMAMKYRD